MENKVLTQGEMGSILRGEDFVSNDKLEEGQTYTYMLSDLVGPKKDFLIIKVINQTTGQVFNLSRFSFNSFTFKGKELAQYFKSSSNPAAPVLFAEKFKILGVKEAKDADGDKIYPYRLYNGYEDYQKAKAKIDKSAKKDDISPDYTKIRKNLKKSGIIEGKEDYYNKIINIDTALLYIEE